MARPKKTKGVRLGNKVDSKPTNEGSTPSTPVYKATLKVLGRIYQSQGNTIDEVIDNFKPEHWIKGAGVLTIEKDGVTREKIISGNHIGNLFGLTNGTRREISLKWVKSLF